MSYCNSWSKWPMIWHVGLVGVDQFHTDFGQSRRNKVEWSNQDIYTVTFVMRQLCGRVFDIWRFYFFLFFLKTINLCTHLFSWLIKKKGIQLKNAGSCAGNTKLLLSYSSCIMTCWFSFNRGMVQDCAWKRWLLSCHFLTLKNNPQSFLLSSFFFFFF